MNLSRIEAERDQRIARGEILSNVAEYEHNDTVNEYRKNIINIFMDKTNLKTIEFQNKFANRAASGHIMHFKRNKVNFSQIYLPPNQQCIIVADILNNLGGVSGTFKCDDWYTKELYFFKN